MSSAGSSSPVAVVLDASVWVSREIPIDRNHAPANVWINSHVQANGHFMEPVWLMAEVAGAISRQMSPPDAVIATALLRYLRRNRIMRFVPMSAALLQNTVDIATIHRIRAGDAVYVALARRLSIPLVSFDTDHLTRAGGIVTVIKP